MSLASAVLANPGAWFAVFAAIFSPFGAAVAWLFREYRKDRLSHRACEVKLAEVLTGRAADLERIGRLEGSVETLTALLKKEVNYG